MPVDPGHKEFKETSSDFVNCPKCGCPNRVADTACSYCDAPLSQKAGMSDRFRQAYESLKWRYKLKSPRSNPGAAVKRQAGAFLSWLL